MEDLSQCAGWQQSIINLEEYGGGRITLQDVTELDATVYKDDDMVMLLVLVTVEQIQVFSSSNQSE